MQLDLLVGGCVGAAFAAGAYLLNKLTAAKPVELNPISASASIGAFTAGGIAVCSVSAASLTSLQTLGVVTVFTACQWLPYLGAAIILNGTAQNPLKGLWLALAYEPLPAKLPTWVKRAQAAHGNSIENLTLFATAVLVAAAVKGVCGSNRQLPDCATSADRAVCTHCK